MTQHEPFHWPRWLMPSADALLVGLAFLVSYWLRYQVQFLQPVDEANDAPFDPYIPYALLSVALMWIGNQGAGLYRERRGRSWWDELFSIGNSATNAAVAVMALSFLLQPLVFSRLLIVQAALLMVIFMGLWRLGLRSVRASMRRRGIGVERVLVVGAGPVGLSVLRTIVSRPDLGYKLIGFVDDDDDRAVTDLGRVPALGRIENLARVLNHQPVDMVIITLPWHQQREVVRIVRECERQHIKVRTVPDLFDLNLSQVQVEMLGGIPLLGINGVGQFNPTSRVLKRGLDLACCLLAMPVILPVGLIVSAAIRLDTPGPVLYAQERVGLNGRRFKVYKFRSMVKDADKLHDKLMRDTGEDLRHPKLVDDPRITRVGRWIRRLSIDELPQIINILRGEMSWVGPRPAVPKEVALYEPWHLQRLRVLPGLTGLWQVSGRSEVPFEEMVLMDIYYIENWSIGLDLQIMLRTAPRVLMAHGAS